MRTIVLKNKVVKVYDSIDEMPIINFQKYNKFLLIDSGIGSDADDIDAHIIKIAKFIKAKDSKKALQELQNMRQNIYMINSEISPKYLAFAALIHSIDGKKVEELSDDNLKNIIEDLNCVKHSIIVDFLTWLKKKVLTELELYFPNDFISAKEKESYDKLKNRTILVLESITKNVDNSEYIDTIDLNIFNSLYNPKSFSGNTSVEIAYDKQFENACIIIAQKLNLNAKNMSVLQFYNALDNIKKQAEIEMKQLKHSK